MQMPQLKPGACETETISTSSLLSSLTPKKKCFAFAISNVFRMFFRQLPGANLT
jgi:hypothetical protein